MNSSLYANDQRERPFRAVSTQLEMVGHGTA